MDNLEDWHPLRTLEILEIPGHPLYEQKLRNGCPGISRNRDEP
jgi:hypothetical protein